MNILEASYNKDSGTPMILCEIPIIYEGKVVIHIKYTLRYSKSLRSFEKLYSNISKKFGIKKRSLSSKLKILEIKFGDNIESLVVITKIETTDSRIVNKARVQNLNKILENGKV